MKITVCIGSSCHIKGSRKVVEEFQRLLREHKLQDQLELAGTFCTGRCNREGVTVSVDDEIFTGLVPSNVEAFFNDKVLSKIENNL